LRTSARRLEEIPNPESPPGEVVRCALALADPERPISIDELTKMLLPEELRRTSRRSRLPLMAVIVAAVAAGLLALFIFLAPPLSV
jgi:hypothetical protein